MRKLFKGQLGLATTFWGFGVIGWLLFVFVRSLSPDFVAQFASPKNLTAMIALMAVLLWLYLVYTCIAAVAVWRSATLYTGKRVWSVLAKIYSVALFLHFLAPVVSPVIPLSHNLATKEVVSSLQPTEDMPYVGFWKTSRFVSHGIAIAPAEDGFYSVSFCAPGGCFEPGEWTPNTKLVDDPCYRIIDIDTIQILGDDDVTTYYRS